MLPPGHIAAGYLVAKAVLVLGHPAFSIAQHNQLIWWGMFFGFAPDLDFFFVFLKMRRFIASDEYNHRKFFSHAPILWFAGGLVIFSVGILSHSLFIEYVGVVAWLASWSHFIFDTIQTGVIWLWPWNQEPLALLDKDIKDDIPPQNFLPYWFKMVKFYITRLIITFLFEAILIILALGVYIHQFL